MKLNDAQIAVIEKAVFDLKAIFACMHPNDEMGALSGRIPNAETLVNLNEYIGEELDGPLFSIADLKSQLELWGYEVIDAPICDGCRSEYIVKFF